MLKKKPTIISLFSGCGGSSLGYKWAGYKELLAIDFNKHAVECFKLNFPNVPVWCKSIQEITGKEILDFTGLSVGELCVLDGSPPCQGFSTAGKRVVTDERNDLFKEYVRLVKDLQPKIFVMENVTGMAKGTMKGMFNEILKTLKSLNYNVKCKQMNAMYYGVPQSRERLIFIGVRKDLKMEPVYPKPNSKVITVRGALNISGKMHRGQFDDKIKSLDNPSYTIMNTPNLTIMSDKRYRDSLLNENKSAPTLTKLSRFFIDKKSIISIEQVKKLCSFPDNFQLIGKFSQQWAVLGNAVMPKFMQAIALILREKILEKLV